MLQVILYRFIGLVSINDLPPLPEVKESARAVNTLVVYWRSLTAGAALPPLSGEEEAGRSGQGASLGC